MLDVTRAALDVIRDRGARWARGDTSSWVSRRALSALDPLGRSLVKELERLAVKVNDAFFAPLQPRERTRLLALMRKLYSAHQGH